MIQRKHYEMSEFLAHADAGKLRYAVDNEDQSGGQSWDAGVSGREATRRARMGDASMVHTVETITNSIENTIAPVERLAWAPHVSGSRVCVPSYLSGSPMNMRRRVPRECAARHVSIYVSMMVSGGLTSEQLMRRGASILGLLSCLERMQIAVDVNLVVHGQSTPGDPDHLLTVKLETQPLSIAAIAFAVAHPAFTRNVLYGVAHRDYGLTQQGWPEEYYTADGGQRFYGDPSLRGGPKYQARLREHLNMQPQDVLIKAAMLRDPIMETPEKWVEKTLAEVIQESA